jgi:hypothetical protein
MPYEPAGEAAERGTAIHEIAEKILNGIEFDQTEISAEYIDLATQYVNYVDSYFESPRKRLVEVNVDEGLKKIHLALGGTADAILVEGNTLACFDLKTGRVPVSALENKQLMTYALGAMMQLNAPWTIDVHLVIFQPGVGVSIHKMSGLELKAHQEQLKVTAELALTSDAPTQIGRAHV